MSDTVYAEHVPALAASALTGPPEGLAAFPGRLVDWQRVHGRHALPWQQTQDPYRVWLSEIMLQQTQVSTVLDYYTRFLDRFPTVADLAAAPLDDVLALWAGLGYYSRARNLHRCAQDVVARFGGEFPRSAEQLETLPGIGRSTASAVAAFCFGERVAILDGNVKRVLSRVLAYEGDLAQARATRALWDIATRLLPRENLARTMPAYTQAQMDLGATLCTPKRPDCPRCPVQDLCAGYRLGEPTRFPIKSRVLKRSSQTLWLLWLRRADGAVWLSQRPVPGVWAGLFCLPLFDEAADLAASVGREVGDAGLHFLPMFTHVLTHKDLHLHPVVHDWPEGAADPALPGRWVDAAQRASTGMPAPITKLLGDGQTRLF
ncbi:A/G-specific adenine glycosylase [Comamonas sp. BIGb0124]|uniref:A/G-specific adenine glycosylase n=1 Tax=Comamonas sp. BIGb0124 TaxID=2485130 RepID=UPI000F485252|nr:A/G-specific adenine glycosylase [Comamonas sp. BIGb0124]